MQWMEKKPLISNRTEMGVSTTTKIFNTTLTNQTLEFIIGLTITANAVYAPYPMVHLSLVSSSDIEVSIITKSVYTVVSLIFVYTLIYSIVIMLSQKLSQYLQLKRLYV